MLCFACSFDTMVSEVFNGDAMFRKAVEDAIRYSIYHYCRDDKYCSEETKRRLSNVVNFKEWKS